MPTQREQLEAAQEADRARMALEADRRKARKVRVFEVFDWTSGILMTLLFGIVIWWLLRWIGCPVAQGLWQGFTVDLPAQWAKDRVWWGQILSGLPPQFTQAGATIQRIWHQLPLSVHLFIGGFLLLGVCLEARFRAQKWMEQDDGQPH